MAGRDNFPGLCFQATFLRVKERLRDPRSRLVAIYAGLVALAYVIHALPGGVHYRGGAGEYAFWIAVDVVLIAYIAQGSRVATAIPLGLNALFVVTYLAFGFGLGPVRADEAVFFLVVAAQTVVLVLLLRRRRGAPSTRPAPVR
jgi:hypothetical protein